MPWSSSFLILSAACIQFSNWTSWRYPHGVPRTPPWLWSVGALVFILPYIDRRLCSISGWTSWRFPHGVPRTPWLWSVGALVARAKDPSLWLISYITDISNNTRPLIGSSNLEALHSIPRSFLSFRYPGLQKEPHWTPLRGLDFLWKCALVRPGQDVFIQLGYVRRILFHKN
jgi:hypothetical protein